MNAGHTHAAMINRLVAAGMCLLVGAGCEEEAPEIDVESSIPVRVEPVSRQPIAEYASATGTVLAVRQAELKCQQSGRYLLQANPRTGAPYAMGDTVQADELLVRLANEEFENQIAIESKRLQLTNSQREYEKQQALFAKGGITLRELTESERAAIDARYAYDNAQLQLAKLEVRAPFAGTLVELPHYSPEQLLEPRASLATVMECRELYADVSLPGKEIQRVLPGQEVLVTHYEGTTADTLTGHVAQVSPVLDADTRMFTARIRVRSDSLQLRPGTFVRMDIVVVERDSALVIPRDVVIDSGERRTVFAVEKGLAVERRLETGLSNRYQVEVLNGLTEGERLVVEGFETLRHHSKVKVER